MTQQVELLRRQLNLLAVARDVATHEIDAKQIARNKDRQLPLRLKGMAQRSAQSCHQLAHAKRLTDVVIGAEVERLHLRSLVVARRQHQDWECRCLADSSSTTSTISALAMRQSRLLLGRSFRHDRHVAFISAIRSLRAVRAPDPPVERDDQRTRLEQHGSFRIGKSTLCCC